ncbi:MAG: MGDG synthase family glycosyltransferase [Candidatus Caldatribacteriaceae bacterium]
MEEWQKSILILMLGLGDTHRGGAFAVRDAIDGLAPFTYGVEVVDLASVAEAKRAERFFRRSWDFALSHPSVALIFNRVIDGLFPLTHSRDLLRYLFPDFTRRSMEYIRDFRPDFVFATHFFCGTLAAMARERYGLPCTVVAFMTDPFVGHRMWVDDHLDFIVASNPVASSYLLENGMPREKVVTLSYPLRAQFSKVVTEEEKEKIRRTYGLIGDRLTLLFTSGEQGIGKTKEYVEAICRHNLPVNIIIVCGRNEKLYRFLGALREDAGLRTNLIVLGYVEEMSTLLAIADLSVSKAGPAITFESLACGCPLVFTHWVCLNEKGNLDFCLREGVGFYAPDVRTFLALLQSIIEERGLLDRCCGNIKRLRATPVLEGIERGSWRVARWIVEQLEASCTAPGVIGCAT